MSLKPLSNCALAALLAACASTQQRAPVVDRSSTAKPATSAQRQSAPPAAKPAPPQQAAQPAKAPDVVVARAQPSWDPNDPRPETHTVLRGETLFGIALAYGLTYREVAEWNGLTEPYVIRVGQPLRLRAPQNTVTVLPAKPSSVDSTTIITDQTKEAGQLGTEPVPATAPGTPIQTPQLETVPRKSQAAASVIKSEPKALKLPYNEATWSRYAQLETGAAAEARFAGAPSEQPQVAAVTVAGKTESQSEPPRTAERAGSNASVAIAAPSAIVEGVDWGWPASALVRAPFSDAAKGIVLSGTVGQGVLASAAGTVSYVGNSLRGYGKMIVIKHNKMFLSVYAHNSKVFVKEGQNVGKGQKIAEMGNTDSESAMLHFEIRRYGKPVDPLKYLPNGAAG